MKKVLFSLLALTLVLVSCGTSPTKFNDALVKANTVISDVAAKYQDDLSKAIDNDSYADIATMTDSALVKIDAELSVVKGLEAPKGGDAFKEAAVKSYESLRTVVETGKKFAALTAESTHEEYSAIEKEYNEQLDAYSKTFDALSKAQMDYAKEAGYKVQ